MMFDIFKLIFRLFGVNFFRLLVWAHVSKNEFVVIYITLDLHKLPGG